MGDTTTFDRDAAAAWVCRQVSVDPPAVFFGLNHVLELHQSTPQTGRPFPRITNEKARLAEALDLVDELHQHAVIMSSTMGRPQRWTISAAWRDDGTQVRAQHGFVVVPSADLPGEQVDPRDYLAVMQRQAEQSHRLLVSSLQQCLDRDAATIAELRVNIRQLEKHGMDLHKQLQLALDEKVKRDVFVKKEEWAIEARQAVFNLAVQWLTAKMIGEQSPRIQVKADDMARFLLCLTADQRRIMDPLLPALSAHMAEDEMKRLAEIVRPPQEGT